MKRYLPLVVAALLGHPGILAQSARQGLEAQIEVRDIRRLPDGNRIEHNEIVTLRRDSTGRERMERSKFVTITDTVKRSRVVLDPARRTANVSGMVGPQVSDAAVDGLRTHERPPNKLGVDVQIRRLGVKKINGFSCDGRLYTTTLASQLIGNKKPIRHTLELWYAKEVQLTMFARDYDLLHGEHTQRVVQVRSPANVSSSLFEIPTNYRIQANGGPNTKADTSGTHAANP